eukprot:UN00004
MGSISSKSFRFQFFSTLFITVETKRLSLLGGRTPRKKNHSLYHY